MTIFLLLPTFLAGCIVGILIGTFDARNWLKSHSNDVYDIRNRLISQLESNVEILKENEELNNMIRKVITEKRDLLLNSLSDKEEIHKHIIFNKKLVDSIIDVINVDNVHGVYLHDKLGDLLIEFFMEYREQSDD